MKEQDSTSFWKGGEVLFETTDQPVPKYKQPNRPGVKAIAKHTGLFVLTFLCVALAGAGFVGFDASLFPVAMPSLSDFWRGALFAGLLLGFLAVHEFGHYFAAYYHKIRVTLPYFIPIPLGIGTLGAVIRIKEKINHSHKMFDVGVAGPLAGFVVSLGVLLFGFATLPDPSYILNFEGHEAVKEYVRANGVFPTMPPGDAPEGGTMIIGNTLLYGFLAQFFQNVPPMWEMYHYPFLFAGWLGLFFTALNLFPVGQLDGGHILYSLIGYKKHRLVARIFFAILITLAGIQAIPSIHLMLGSWDPTGMLSLFIWVATLFLLLRKAYNGDHTWIAPVLIASLAISVGYLFFVVGNISTPGSLIWVVWSFFLAFLVGVEHPPALYEKPLDPTRKYLGWASMAIFVLCISPNPIYLI